MRCTVADLAAGATATLTFGYTIGSSVATGTLLDHSATISTTGTDSNSGNNTASVSTPVVESLVLTKTANFTTVGDNQLVTYTVKLTRNSSASGTLNFTISDSYTGNNVLNGNWGGTMTYLMNSGTCTGVTCTVPGSTTARTDINEGPISVALDNPGSEAVLTYQARSSNLSVTTGKNSIINNNVTATDEASVIPTLTDTYSVTITGLPPNPPPPGPTPGGGGGGGGGRVVYKGDMELKVEKMVSTDGQKYTSASTKDIAIAIPENKKTPLYTKVKVTNLGKVSAANIKFKHFFEEGKSDITAGSVSDVVGATLNGDYLKIDKIKVGETYTFSYKVNLTEDGKNTNPAKDGLELDSFKSNLPSVQDGFTYKGIGDEFTTYIYAGSVPAGVSTGVTDPSAATSASKILSIVVKSDKSSAKVGETVNLTISLKNLTDDDLTDMFIDHKYDTDAFSVVSAPGAQDDSKGVHWKRPMLRPDQTAVFNLSLKVLKSAPVGTTVSGLTSALVNEYSDIAPVYSFINITAGAAAVEPERPYELAATGPMGVMIMLMILSALGYLGHGYVRHSLYLRRKKLALANI
jgi:hypothetical protein